MEGLEAPEYPPLGPFATLYEEWLDAYPRPRDPEIEARLAATYRDAWAGGDPMEQYYVLSFVMHRKSEGDTDIVFDGLASEDSKVAGHASAIASVWQGLYSYDLGPTIVEAWRNHVLRHPIGDITRPDEFRRPGDGWPQGRPFIELYEQWMSDPFPRDAKIEERLAARYQDTWDHGDPVDRAFVLHFLGYHRGDPRPDLVFEGLRSEDYRLARTAMFRLHDVIEAGHDLGSDIRDVIRDHVRRYPASYTMAVGAFLDLNKREGKEPAK